MEFPETLDKNVVKTSDQGIYSYATVEGDKLGVRFYVLANGLTVILSVNKAEPRIQAFVAVKAGSKNDPSDHTGLAHYLEHLMFKGTDRYGTKDYATEKIYLDQIDQLYEDYNHTTDEAQRMEIYKKIDSVSGTAAKYAIPNEYDKMATSLGATGTNAFTSVEETVYINNIPSNELESWLILEGERFRNPVFRLFHTELETVYEEKNRGLDNDDVKVDEALMSGIFRNHPYGTQTTIGTIEHLRNPSLEKIRQYYSTYYVPNNMAVILAGDLDPDKTVALVDKYFSQLEPKPVPQFTFKPETERNEPIIKTVLGPKAAEVNIAFRFPGAGTREALLLRIASSLLFNDKAGLIDINLLKSQKLLDAYADISVHKDYSYQLIQGVPTTGQNLEDVRNLLFDQLEKLKTGDFDSDLITAIINNLRISDIQKQENNTSRAFTIMEAFVTGRNWADVVEENDNFKKITKDDVVLFVNKWYRNDYVVVYKEVGEDKNVVKVQKPPITQVVINRDDVSDFASKILHASADPLKPVFLDYKKLISVTELADKVPLYYLKNTENERFTLYYFLDMGRDNDTQLPIAANYLQFLGTDKYTADQISHEFYKLAASFGVSVSNDRTYIYLTGLQENFDASISLFEELLNRAKPDQEALDALISNTIQERENQKMNKDVILFRGMVSYAKYGPKNPFNNNLSNEELQKLNGETLTGYLRNLNAYQHKIYYYGPAAENDLSTILNKRHRTQGELKPYPSPIKFKAIQIEENKVFFSDFDMVQANIYWVAKGDPYNINKLAEGALFNEYFGGSMGSIVFQALREARALAYSTYSRYETPNRKSDPFFVTAFIGTQFDKIDEAIGGMNDLLHHLPQTDVLLENARKGLKGQIEAQRIIRNDILMNYDQAARMGNDHDVRRDVYENLDKFTIDDLDHFHQENYASRDYTLCVLASKKSINPADLDKYGKVEELTLEQIFGY